MPTGTKLRALLLLLAAGTAFAAGWRAARHPGRPLGAPGAAGTPPTALAPGWPGAAGAPGGGGTAPGAAAGAASGGASGATQGGTGGTGGGGAPGAPAGGGAGPGAAGGQGGAAPARPEVYTVQPGDTLYASSRRLQVDVAALMAANGLSSPVIVPGQRLKVPHGPATEHVVRPGDTAWDIASLYGITLEALAAANPGLEDLGLLQVGTVLKLPAGARYGAAAREQPPSIATGATYIWPVSGWISSPFGPRVSPVDGVPRFHSGIDIAANMGDPIRAARAGTVVTAGWLPGYGYTVILEHPDGTRTLYGHASQILVNKGDRVEQGQVIARVGSTGASTGPHLHFEIIAGNPVDPLRYLPTQGR